LPIDTAWDRAKISKYQNKEFKNPHPMHRSIDVTFSCGLG